MFMALWGLAAEAGLTHQKFLAGGPLQTGAAWAAAGQAGGSPPASLQAKIERMHALAHQRQQEGVDMRPIVAIAHGIQPLLEQQKYTEAEALVDRVLKLLSDSPTAVTPSAAQQSGTSSGGVPPSLQAKMARLHTLAHQRQQEGFDMEPVKAIADGIHPLMEQQKFAEAEAQVDRALKLLGDSPTPEASTPAQQPAATPAGVPPSLQAKMQKLHNLFERRNQEGADLQPVEEVMHDFHPLMQQQKYAEAEAQVDRALKLLGDSPTREAQPGAGGSQEQPVGSPAGAKPFPCPAAGAAIDLASGVWALQGDCTVKGLNLRGDAQLWVEGLALTVDGNIALEQNAGLHVHGGSFTVANHFKLEYHLSAKGNALLDFRDVKVSMNAGVAANLTSVYAGSDDSLLHIENVQIERTHSWLLCNLRDRARMDTKNSPDFPSEIYPTGNSTVRIEGPHSGNAVWLHFEPGSSAVLDNLPASHPSTFSFGRNTPGVTGIGYQVDWVDANAGLGIDSFPRSNVTVKNRHLGLGYHFSNVTTPETVTGLKGGGPQTGTYRNQGRVLTLEDVSLPPYGWQVYSSNEGIPLESVAPVTITDSLINELGASNQGRFEVSHVLFAFAALAAVGPHSRVHVRDSVINSHTIMGNSDGVVKIEDSEIYGSRVQAIGHSRILILNTALRMNEPHATCAPDYPAPDGSTPTRCNRHNPAREIEFVASGQGAVLVAGIDPIATAIRPGSTYAFVGDAIVRTPEDRPYTYNLRYRRTSASAFTSIATGATGPKRAQPLGQLDTTGVAPGDYIVQLELVVPGQEPVAVQRFVTIGGPSSGGVPPSTAEGPAPAQQPSGMAPGAVPASLQAKRQRIHILGGRRKQEGADVREPTELMKGYDSLVRQQKYAEAEALCDRVLKLLGEPPTALAAAPPQQPGATPGAVPPSLQAKMQRLHTLFERRKQEGADLQPVEEVMQDFHPLMQQQKYAEAEAVVDRALKVLGESSTPEAQPTAGTNEEKLAASAAGAKPFACPGAGSPIDLASGNWALGSDCTTNGINLRGDAQLWVENLALRVEGNINLEQNAGLHIRGGSFNLANHFKFEYHLTNKGNGLLEFRDVKVEMNAGVAANLTSGYQGSDDSRLYIENVQIEPTHSWILVNLHDRARVETKNSPHFPSEIYPADSSTVRIEGARSSHRVWLHFSPGTTAVLDNLPASHPYTFSFGRNTPGVAGIGYQVDVLDGDADFGIDSFPDSHVTVRNSRGNLGLGYHFADVTTPETLTGLKGGEQTVTLRNQGRVLDLEDAELPPYGWQIYSINDGIAPEKVAPVTITDSLINELGAFKQGRFEVAHAQFAFAGIAAAGPSSVVHIRDSVINSHTVMGNSDGVVKIENSEIFGSRVQAIANSRIFILNTPLRRNERNPKCVPLLRLWGGVPFDRCNPANPGYESELIARGQGAIWVAGIDPIAQAIRPGSTYTFVGNAILKTADDKPYTYNLRYRQVSASAFTAITAGATGPKRGQPLGQLDTTGLASGDYIVQLDLEGPGQEPVVVQRSFTIAAQSSGAVPASTPEASAAAQQPAATPAGVPPSLQAKMQKLHTLFERRKQEGADLQPIEEVMHDFHPLMNQQKYAEAEAVVDRALKLVGDSPTPQAPPAAGTSEEKPGSSAAGAKPFPCPAVGAPIDLASGNWALGSDCTTSSLNLHGDAQLWAEGRALRVDGNASLADNAGLHMHGGSFNIANQYKLQYHITAKGHALVDLRDMQMFTNAGVAANLTSSYDGFDDSRLHIENVQLDHFTSWLLCHVRDRATVETKNSPHFPSEIYPSGSSTVRIEGPESHHAVWLNFIPGSTAVLDNLPASHPFTFSFGRNTPGVTGVGYQVDVVNGTAGFGIDSFPRSNVTVRNCRGVNLGYHFSDVTTPESLTGLKGGGPQIGIYRNQGRVLDLEEAGTPPWGWQIYSSNDHIPLASVAPVTITDSLINELGASNQGRFEISHVQFAFAALAAVGPGSSVHVRDSIINSHTIMGNADGVVRIEDSEIFGSRVQAIANSRILILNTALRRNEPNPKCVPVIPSLDGGPRTRCNPYNPLHESEFIARGQGAVWVAGIEPIAQPIRPGSSYAFVGDAFLKTADDKPYSYNLRYRQASASTFTSIAAGATGPKRGQPLGQLDTTGMAPGDYIVQLELVGPGQELITVQRPFTISGP
jgi:hypothetical protein